MIKTPCPHNPSPRPPQPVVSATGGTRHLAAPVQGYAIRERAELVLHLRNCRRILEDSDWWVPALFLLPPPPPCSSWDVTSLRSQRLFRRLALWLWSQIDRDRSGTDASIDPTEGLAIIPSALAVRATDDCVFLRSGAKICITAKERATAWFGPVIIIPKLKIAGQCNRTFPCRNDPPPFRCPTFVSFVGNGDIQRRSCLVTEIQIGQCRTRRKCLHCQNCK